LAIPSSLQIKSPRNSEVFLSAAAIANLLMKQFENLKIKMPKPFGACVLLESLPTTFAK
jgi:hypothetical protein